MVDNLTINEWRKVWRAALTLVNNLCVQESDRINADDGSPEAMDALSETLTRIRGWLEPSDPQFLQMLREANALPSVHETTDSHEADLANQLQAVDRAYREALKQIDILKARIPAGDYILLSDTGEIHHKDYGQVLFATHDSVRPGSPEETFIPETIPNPADQVLKEFFSKHALGPLARPSCLVCGHVPPEWPPGIQHAELPGIVVCTRCRDAGQRSAQETSTDGWKCVSCGHENPKGTLRCQNLNCAALIGEHVHQWHADGYCMTCPMRQSLAEKASEPLCNARITAYGESLMCEYSAGHTGKHKAESPNVGGTLIWADPQVNGLANATISNKENNDGT